MSHKWRLTSLILVLFGFFQTRSTAENHPAWIEVRSPNFIVVTNANQSQGRRTAYQFEMIRAVFRDFFGMTGKSLEPPITIIAAKDEKTLKALLPEFWEKKGLAHPAGVCLNTADTSVGRDSESGGHRAIRARLSRVRALSNQATGGSLARVVDRRLCRVLR